MSKKRGASKDGVFIGARSIEGGVGAKREEWVHKRKSRFLT